MNKEILKTKYVEVMFEEETKIYSSKYLPATLNMSDKEWQEQMLELKMLIETYEPDFIIDDNRERLYSYSPDMQVWTLNIFVDSWNKIGLKKYVQILPKEIVAKLTSEQIKEFVVTDFNMLYQHHFVIHIFYLFWFPINLQIDLVVLLLPLYFEIHCNLS